jgi:hypothetical protein
LALVQCRQSVDSRQLADESLRPDAGEAMATVKKSSKKKTVSNKKTVKNKAKGVIADGKDIVKGAARGAAAGALDGVIKQAKKAKRKVASSGDRKQRMAAAK